jgi:glycosyltransferase involved in cell wall biosynthesis
LKIVIFCAYFQPELGYREYYYARNLAKLGHEVTVITSDRIMPYPGWENIAKSAGYDTSRYRGAGVSQLDGFTLYRLSVLFEYERLIVFRGVSKLLSLIKPDIVHIIENGFVYSLPVIFHKQSIGYKVIYEIEISISSTHLLRKREYVEYYLAKKPLLKYMIGRSDGLNICTNQVQDFLYKQIKESRGKIHRIPLGADPDLFYMNSQERADARKMLNVAEDEILILTSGKIEPHKHYDVLIKSVGAVKNEYPRIKLLIVGSGTENAVTELKKIAESEGILDLVIFHPFVKNTELRKFYNAADIGTWTRATITMLEAIACGLPVIVPNMDATCHLVEEGNGLLYEYCNYSQLTDCLKLYMIPENRMESRKRAISVFEQKYSYLTLAKQLVDELYLPVLRGKT